MIYCRNVNLEINYISVQSILIHISSTCLVSGLKLRLDVSRSKPCILKTQSLVAFKT